MTKYEENIVNIAMRAAMLLHTGQISYDDTTGHMGLTETIISLSSQFEDQYADVDFNAPGEARDYWEEIDRYADDKLLWMYGSDPDAAEEQHRETGSEEKQIVVFNESSEEELNVQLYYKMSEEFDTYKMQLMEMPAEDILNKAYYFVLREDLLSAMENNDLEAEQAAALLSLDNPLETALQVFQDSESPTHMEEVWQAIEDAANQQMEGAKVNES